MGTRIRAGRAALLVFVLSATAVGCHTLEPSTPLTVQVRDAETQAPIPSATVHVWRYGSHADEREQSFTTGSDGDTTARLAPPEEGGVMVEVIAPGHLQTQMSIPNNVVDALASAKPFHPYKGEPLVVTVNSYAGPRPTAELVLPPGFRGLVKAEMHVVPDGTWPVGQRAFSYTLSDKGVVDVSGPPVFNIGVGPEFVARFADAQQPLPKDPTKGDIVGLRWLRRDNPGLPCTVYFAVGTSADAISARSALGPDSAYSDGKSSSKGGRGGGGGGGGGMGGMGGRGGRGGGGMGGPGGGPGGP